MSVVFILFVSRHGSILGKVIILDVSRGVEPATVHEPYNHSEKSHKYRSQKQPLYFQTEDNITLFQYFKM